MVTASAIVKKIVSDKPLFQEGLRQGLINYAALAEGITHQVEQQLGSRVKISAIAMALRRCGEGLQSDDHKRTRLEANSQLTLKTGLAYFSVKRSSTLFKKLESAYRLIDHAAGDTLNIIHGNNDVSIITNERNKIASLLENEHVTIEEKKLVSITMTLPESFPYTPGAIFAATRQLYWDNINIFELVTTATELTFIFQKKDAMRAYASLQELISE
jgi:hypothetical protein